MYYLLSLLIGVIIGVMVFFNSGLTAEYGVFGAALIIYLLGAVCSGASLAVSGQKLSMKGKKLPIWMFMAGPLSLLCTVFNNYAFGKISITGIVALGLLGQTVSSLFIDMLGLFGMKKQHFRASVLLCLAFAAAGIYIMLKDATVEAYYAALLSFLTGCLAVFSRAVNAGLSERIGKLQCSLISHLTALPLALAALLLLGGTEPIMDGFKLSPRVWIYLGGVIGVAVIYLCNVTLNKIPATHFTMVRFAAQIGTGVLVDLVSKQSYMPTLLLGAVLVALGIGLNMLIDALAKNRKRLG